MNQHSVEDDQTYICPMDPEVVRKEPGDCPKCGMDLEQTQKSKIDRSVTTTKVGGALAICDHSVDYKIQKEHNERHFGMEESFKRRFFLALPLTIVVLLLSPKIQQWFHFTITFSGIEFFLFVLASTIVFYTGWPFYVMAKSEIKTRAFGMMTLVSLAVLSGYAFSVAATFLFEGESLYWEISTLVLAFLFGHWMEMRAVRGASGALAELAKLIPPTAHKINSESKVELIDVKTEELLKGDRVLVKPGEKVPIDGLVIDGESSVNEAMITGESKPVGKKKGDEVIGGAINNDGSLTIEVSKTGEETAVSQMMELVRSAQETKPPVQKLADSAAKWLTFTAIIVGISVFVFWFFVSPQGVIFAGTLAIAVIVIACPHALGLAIPIVTTITTSLAAKNGILIRDMKAVEIIRKVSCVVFDKTGTLTKGEFGISHITPLTEIAEEKILSYIAAIDFHSQHSLAQSVVAEAHRRGLTFAPARDFRSFPGMGAAGRVDGQEILVGNQALMNQNGLRADKYENMIIEARLTGKTFIWVAADKNLIGVVILEDAIREESKEAVDALKKIGIKTVMLTGDNQTIAQSVAKELGIEIFFAEVSPEDKVNKIKQLQNEGNVVVMVGDGVNDAASLTQAHAGIAIGAGTDIAAQSAGIVLVKDDPRDVLKAINLSRKTNSKMRQNLAWAAGYNLIAIPIAAGILFPFGILLRPEWSALLMSASSIIVVINALTLRRTNLN